MLIDSNLKVHRIYVERLDSPSRSEVESEIIKYAETNDLVLPSHYKCFARNDRPHTQLWLIAIEFSARSKTHDDLLREQIEFQIKELEK